MVREAFGRLIPSLCCDLGTIFCEMIMPLTMATCNPGLMARGRTKGVDAVRGSAGVCSRVELDLDTARYFLPLPGLPRWLVVSIEGVGATQHNRPKLWGDLTKVPPEQRVLGRHINPGVFHLIEQVLPLCPEGSVG